VSSNWPNKTLGEVSAISYGFTESSCLESVGPKFLRITDIQDGNVDWSAVPYCRIKTAEIPRYRLASGDIVFARTGASTGKSFLVENPPDAVFASYLIRLRLMNNTLLPQFVSMFLQTATYWNAVAAGLTGSAQGGFNASKLSALTIPVPPLPEQQRIVRILDEAFASIATAKANAEKNLQNARALFESLLQFYFDQAWQDCELIPLIQIAEEITDGDHLPPPKASAGVPFITIGNIEKQTRTIDFTDTFFVKQEYFDQLKSNKKPKCGDLLYTVTGSFGIPVIVTRSTFCFQRHIALIRPNCRNNTSWVYYLLLSPQLRRQADERATGTAQKTVSLSVLRKFMVPKIPLEKQKSAALVLDSVAAKVQDLESIYHRQLIALRTLKQSLLHQAFMGSL